ncbi:hypothetical protein JTY60_00515 [symbiont of Argiope bruennichi]|uniref:dTMP kinase n=1 Tax=symbiont of Argiope bruennichi TaxID=2810479 RepID=UPI003DA6B316
MIIVFEGADGVGKSSVINELKNDPFIKDNDFIFCKEPADNDKYLKTLRNLILTEENYKISDFLLLMASRARHFKKYIIPHINEKNFIFDRYTYSSFVYQLEHEKDLSYMNQIIKITFEHLTEGKLEVFNKIVSPDIVFYFVCDLKKQIDRQKEQKNEIFRFEKKSMIEKAKIKEKYEKLFVQTIKDDLGNPKEALHSNVFKIDTTNKSIIEIKKICLEKIKEFIENEAKKIQTNK